MVDFKPDRDILDLSGKVILVTGGNVGLGHEIIYQLSKHKPARIYLAARSKSKAEQAIDDITRFAPDHAPISFLELDLTSFESIKSAAKSFIASNDRLDILVNNAGIMACPAGLTYEIQFGTNHVGHALLTKLLLPVLQRTAEYQPTGSVRIVNVSSGSESFAPVPAGIEFDKLKDASRDGMGTWARYGQSKLANIHHTRALAAQFPELMCVSLHPGNVNTNLKSGPIQSYGSWLSPFLKTILGILDQSIQGSLWSTVG